VVDRAVTNQDDDGYNFYPHLVCSIESGGRLGRGRCSRCGSAIDPERSSGSKILPIEILIFAAWINVAIAFLARGESLIFNFVTFLNLFPDRHFRVLG
jgi:hypothetical protein